MPPSLFICRICKSKKTRLYLQTAGEKLDQCKKCGFTQVRNKPSKKSIAKIYAKKYFENAKYKNYFAQNKENQRRLFLLKKYIEKNKSVLDAGCSVGEFLKIAQNQYKIFGTDISKSAISACRKKYPELSSRVKVHNLESPFGHNKKYFAICLWDVVEHLWDPAKTIKTLYSQLETGGYLFISTPAIDSLMAKICGKAWAFMTPPEHLGFFTKASIQELFLAQLKAKIIYLRQHGKWANLAFILYKINRVLPSLVPKFLLQIFNAVQAKRINIYVPSMDIHYLVIKRTRKRI